MKVSDVMTKDISLANPDQSVKEVAALMAKNDIGSLPVGDHDRLVGMITDRDIVIRGVALGKGPDAKVKDVMTDDVKYVFEDEEVDHVAKNMGDNQVRRLPVLNRAKRLVGILALGDLARGKGSKHAVKALHGISQPGH